MQKDELVPCYSRACTSVYCANTTLTSEVTLLLLTDDSGPGQASKAELEKKCLLLQQQVHEMEVK